VELRQLEYFRAVVEAGSFLGASKQLATAQPTVWRQVKALERELGVSLFERSGRRVKPTSSGMVLLPLTEQILGNANRLKFVASELKQGRTGIVSIECAHPHLETFLAPLLGGFHATRPEVKLEIRGHSGFPPIGRVIDGESDFITSLPNADPRLAGIQLGDAHIIVVTPDDHPWRRRATVDVTELAETMVALGHASSLTRSVLEPVLQSKNIHLDVAYQSSDMPSLIALAHAGLGVAVVAENHLADTLECAWPTLCDDGTAMGTPVWLCWSAERALSAPATEFVMHVKRTLEPRPASTKCTARSSPS